MKLRRRLAMVAITALGTATPAVAAAALDAAARWISPFALLELVVDGALRAAWPRAFASLAAAIGYALLMLGLAAWWLRRRGVWRRGE